MDLKDKANEGHSNPVNWKFGIFYFNKKDKRIFPPKKDKYAGWTVNFANPYSILAIIALLILFTLITKYFSKA
ncbi:MAG: DUF5808 domain-containing protein [Bacteroidota bacterium]|nr:DUF5808 domain-containing protein [Bacteroidota bacterium]